MKLTKNESSLLFQGGQVVAGMAALKVVHHSKHNFKVTREGETQLPFLGFHPELLAEHIYSKAFEK